LDQLLGIVVIAIIIWFLVKRSKRKKEDGDSETKSHWERFKAIRPKPKNGKAKKKGKTRGKQGLTFQSTRTTPETDDQGRVIVRLGTGEQIYLDVRPSGDVQTDYFFMGKPKKDYIEHKVRVRVTKIAGSDKYQVASPSGLVVGEIEFKVQSFADVVFQKINAELPKLHKLLKNRQFVFDVSASVEGDWLEDSDEASGWAASVDSIVIRIKDPASIDIR
jgi:hypothetical protein